MPGRKYRTDDDDVPWDDEDPEGPQARDLTDEDEDETATVPCPSCGRHVADFADRCPYCGDWIVQGGGSGSRPWWVIAIVIVLVLVLLGWWVF